MTPQLYVQEKAARSGSSFYYTFLFLPPDRREAITAFYAFCREVDDIVDEVHDPGVAAAKLAWWRGEVRASFDGRASHPVMQALTPHLSAFELRPEYFLGIIDGVEMDLRQTRWLDFAGLAHYCHLVAGLVGMAASGIFGRQHPRTLEYADRLGLAFQLTNIIRDVGEDARRGRIYLPMDELRRFEVPASDILQARYSPAFTRLMQFQADRALALYDEALSLLPDEDLRAQRPGLMMAAIYRTLLLEIARDGFQVLHQRTSLTPIRKLWLAWRTWVFGWRR
jgi:phytoene synthase